MRILLQPSSGPDAQKHFHDTIENGVLLETIKDLLKPKDYEEIKGELGTQVKVWGIVPNKDGTPRSEWTNLGENDLVIFYAKKRFFYFARAANKIHNKTLAKAIWGLDDQGKTWEYIYFIKEARQIDVPYKPEVIGYASNHVIYGATLLIPEKSALMYSYLEEHNGEFIDEDAIEPSKEEEATFSKEIKKLVTQEEAQKEIERLSVLLMNMPVRERIVKAKILVRNAAIARLVKARAEYICEVCGVSPFTQKSGMPFAEAHHKYELAKTRLDNPHHIICVCPTCHRVIHYGNDDSLESRKKPPSKE